MLSCDSARNLGDLLQIFHVHASFVGSGGCSFCHTFDGINKCCQSSDDMIPMTHCRPSDAHMLELDRIRESLGLCVAYERIVRSVVLSRSEQVMSLL